MEYSEGNSTTVTPNGFSFTISNGQVTGMQRVIGSKTLAYHLPANATFSLDPTTAAITETITGTTATESLKYTQDPLSANLYHLASESETITNPSTTNAKGQTDAYSFTITNGAVSAMQEVWGDSSKTHTHNLLLPPTASFSVNGNTVTETLVEGNSIETLQFVASGSGGLYAFAGETTSFVQVGAAATPLSVNPFDRAEFSLDSSGKVTQVQQVRPDGTVATVTPSSHISFSQLATGYVLETITIGAHSSFELYHDGNGDGIYTAIAHGAGTSVDLVGLQAQLSPTINALT